MDAPERLYLDTEVVHPAGKRKVSIYRTSDADIEYVRTDAFIEKACEWLNNRGCLYIQYSEGGTSFNNKQFIGDFKKAMEL